MHPPPTAVAIFVTSVAQGPTRRGVLLLMMVVLLQFGVGTRRVRDLTLEVRLTAVHPRLVHADFELAGPRKGRVAASVLVVVEGVEVIAVIALGSVRSFDQSVDYYDQQDQDPRGKDTSTGNARLHLKYQEHVDGHSCQRGWRMKNRK